MDKTRMDKIPNWTKSWMDKIPDEQSPELNQLQQ